MPNTKSKINQEAMTKLTNYEKHLQEEMKNKEFREAFEKEGVCLKDKIFIPTVAEKKSLKRAREKKLLLQKQIIRSSTSQGGQTSINDKLQLFQ